MLLVSFIGFPICPFRLVMSSSVSFILFSLAPLCFPKFIHICLGGQSGISVFLRLLCSEIKRLELYAVSTNACISTTRSLCQSKVFKVLLGGYSVLDVLLFKA